MGRSQVIDRDSLLAKLAEKSGLEAEALEEARHEEKPNQKL